MFSDFNKVFVLSMSNSEVFSVEFDVLKKPRGEFHKSDDVATAVSNDGEKEDKFKETFILSKDHVKSAESGEEFKATDQHKDENDDGFKTPTSLDHKIPITQCPPAPRKPSSSTRKRRQISSNARRTLRLDLSREVESMFPQPIFDDLHRKIKKARREN